MSQSTLNLKQWFYRNARVPILFTLVAFSAVEILLLTVIGKNQFEHQRGVAERLAEVSRLALEEKSTALLQAGFDIARRELNASRAFVCEQSLMYVTVPPRLSNCPVEDKLGDRVIEVPISLPNRLRTPPFQQHKFVLQVPVFPRDELIYYTLGISILVCCLGIALLRRLSHRLELDLFAPLFKNLSSDLKLPIRELEEIRKKIVQIGRLKTEAAVTAAIISRNQQVSHDIKSPLTALLFASKDFDKLPESSRKVIQAAVKRINSIADSLMEVPQENSELISKEERELSEILNELMEEKKLEYFDQKNIEWLLEVDPSTQKTKSPAPELEIKRALSNLINNSVEAFEGREGRVHLRVKTNEGGLRIEVKDNGKGIENKLLTQVGKKGFSFGKKSGKGLGVSFARETVEKRGGKLSISSQVNRGTEVQLCFFS